MPVSASPSAHGGAWSLRRLPSPARLLVWASLAICGQVWTWRETVPQWLWLAVMLLGWLCVRTALRARGGGGEAAAGSRFETGWAVACGACAYAAHLHHLPDAPTWVAVAVLAAWLRAPAIWAAMALVASALGVVGSVLWRVGEADAALVLARMGSAWGCGLLAACTVAHLLKPVQGRAFAAFGRGFEDASYARVDATPAPHMPPSHLPGGMWHGRALVATAACVPLGEGLALIMLGVTAAIAAFRWRAARDARGWQHAAVRVVGWGLCCWAVAGAWALVIGGEGWLKPSELGRWVPYAAMILPVVAVGAVRKRYFELAASAFVASLLVASAAGLVVYGLDLRPGSGILQMLPVPSAQSRVPDTLRSVAGGFYFHRLKMAHVLLVGMACLAVRQVTCRLGTQRRIAELAILAAMATTQVFTFARGAWIGVAALLAVCAWLASWRWRALLLCVALGACAGVMALPEQRARLLSTTDPAASAIRATVWEQASLVLQEHPWGVGLGNYTPVIGRYYDKFDAGRVFPRTYPHNMVLAAWAETGPCGLAGYVAVWVAFFALCLRAVRHPREGYAQDRLVGGTGLAGGVALWVVGLTHDVLFHNAVALAFCGMAGLVMALLIAPPEHAHMRDPCL